MASEAFCAECGAEVPSGSVRCPECGKPAVAVHPRLTEIEKPTPKTLPSTERRQGSGWRVLGSFVVVVVSLLVLAWIVATSGA